MRKERVRDDLSYGLLAARGDEKSVKKAFESIDEE